MAAALTEKPRRRGGRQQPGHWLRHLLLFLAMLFYLLPIYVMVVNGFRATEDVTLATMWELPTRLTGGALLEALARLGPNLRNSFVVVIPATINTALIGAINGYLLSKWKFRGSDLLFTLMIFGLFIPYQAILLPLVRFLQLVGLYGTLPGLVLVHTVYGLPIATLMFRNYFVSIPKAIMDAARVDGAGLVRIFFEIMLPLALPAFAVVAVFQFTSIWNDFLFGITVVPNPTAQPVTVALYNLAGSLSVDWNVVMGSALVAALPTAVVYLLFSRFFARGVLAGSVKG
jgi:glucose/mannose transport system permease protein